MHGSIFYQKIGLDPTENSVDVTEKEETEVKENVGENIA